jgi:hypothetical protein
VKPPCSTWFDGYSGQRCALFDDYRGSWLPFSLALNVFDTGGYQVPVPVKGGHALWTATFIVVTSNELPSDLYKCDCTPLIRRLSNFPGHENQILEIRIDNGQRTHIWRHPDHFDHH